MKNKLCPLMSYQKQYNAGVECIEGECGLWDSEKNQCSNVTKAQALSSVAITLENCSDGATLRIGKVY